MVVYDVTSIVSKNRNVIDGKLLPFFQEVMIGGAAETSMSEKVHSSADLYYSILYYNKCGFYF